MSGRKHSASGPEIPEGSRLNPPRFMSQKEIQAIAKCAAKEATQDLLLAMGIDSSSPQAIKEAQADSLFLRRQRIASEQLGRHAKKVLIGALVLGALGAVWAGIKAG